MTHITNRARVLAIVSASLVSTFAGFAQAKHLVGVGVDGLSPDGVLKANAAQTIKRYRETKQQLSGPKFLKFCYGAQVIESQS